MTGIQEMLKLVLEKLKQAFLAIGNVFSWFNHLSLPDTWKDNITHWLTAVQNLGGDALAWFDSVFPPGTRAQKIKLWLSLALPYLIAAVVLVAAVWICRRCAVFVFRGIAGAGRLVSRMMRAVGRFLCCGGARRGVAGGTAKMMKAPGRNLVIPRSWFESDPKGYFSNLRSHPGDHLC